MNITFIERRSGVTYAVSNTGPLISAFQSDRFGLLIQIFAAIFVSTARVTELKEHGWDEELLTASSHIQVLTLTAQEEQQALAFAQQIA